MVEGGVLSCVVDTAPSFQLELFRWFATATKCARISPSRLVVHAVSPGQSEILRYVERSGATVVPIDPFDQRSPHCNKVTGAMELAKSIGHRPLALTDTDMLIMQDPTAVAHGPGVIGGKRVDLAHPPLSILDSVFQLAGLALPPALSGPESTLLGNLNGGLYVLDGSDLGDLSAAWERWARWLVERLDLLETYSVHVDQVAMCLAIVQCEMEVELLDISWNLPTHLPGYLPSHIAEPNLIHYHWCVTATGLISTTGHRLVDRSIRDANTAILDLAGEFFPARVYREWRQKILDNGEDHDEGGGLSLADLASSTRDVSKSASVIRLLHAFAGEPPSLELAHAAVARARASQESAEEVVEAFAVEGKLNLTALRGAIDASDDKGFVERMYRALLGRSPDPSGFAHWLDALSSGVGRHDVIRSFAGSDEFRGRYPYGEVLRAATGAIS